MIKDDDDDDDDVDVDDKGCGCATGGLMMILGVDGLSLCRDHCKCLFAFAFPTDCDRFIRHLANEEKQMFNTFEH